MRLTSPSRLAGAAFAASLFAVPALAQTPPTATSAPKPAASAPAPAGTPAPGAAAAQPDPIVARVGSDEVHLSDLSESAQTLPEEMRGMPPATLYPLLLDQMIDRKAIVIEARKEKLQNDPQVQRAIAHATDTALQNAVLSREIGPLVTDAALHARYDQTIAGKTGEEEVHASHILVANEDEAKQIIADLNQGGDFAALAKQHSTDPAAQQGGDLGFFKKADMVPEFAETAFALKAGEVAQSPVHTQFGWHVIKVIERRVAPAPTFEQARDEIRQQIIQDGIRKVVEKAKAGLPVQRFMADGSPMPSPGAALNATPTAPPGTAAQPGISAPAQPPVR